ncbi:Regulator of telomere elongation helicase 1 -like protein [Halotydeus destructor]|nr:Regulator of telomere elongation helicase 1 -like protein [Halotydeus destructor]
MGERKMYPIQISGYEILFPYEPYSIQRAYMSQLLRCLKNKENGLLESPTGTGKTLSILCASLAWLDKALDDDMMKAMSFANPERPLEVTLSRSALNGSDLDGPRRSRREESQPFASASRMRTDNETPLMKKLMNSLDMGDPTPSDLISSGQKAASFIGPRVIYSSRTHSQLSQAMKEMKRTQYSNINAVILGSRDQLCIHADVQKLETISAKNMACRSKTKNNSCVFYDNYDMKTQSATFDSNIVDIEDLLEFGQKNTCCPYYATKVLKNRSQVLFLPYNYLLEPSIRKAQAIDVKGAAIIFDEGHNIEQNCEDSASTELSSQTLAFCITESTKLLELMKQNLEEDAEVNDMTDLEFKEAVKEFQLEEVLLLKNMICDLEEQIDKKVKSQTGVQDYLPFDWLLRILDNINLSIGYARRLCGTIEKISEHFSSIGTTSTAASITSRLSCFDSVANFLKSVYPEHISEYEYGDYVHQFKTKYRLATVKEDASQKYKQSKGADGWLSTSKELVNVNAWTFHMYCLSPSISMRQLISNGVNNVVITSGTLSPLESFSVEMETPFSVQLQNQHVISDNQLKVCLLSNYVDGTVLSSKFDNRGPKYYNALGATILDYSRCVPDGILLFFTSYSVRDDCFIEWKKTSIYNKLRESKEIFLEPRNKHAFAECITKYKEHIDDPYTNGALFVGICRGKLSEGLDLANKYCRCVMVAGLPFPNVKDTRVTLKQKYLQENPDSKLSPSQWYHLQMKRAVNQAIGRVVRHKNDYGCVLLFDSRFSHYRDGLSRWMQKYVVSEDYVTTKRIIEQFFRNMANRDAGAICTSAEVKKEPETKPIIVKNTVVTKNPEVEIVSNDRINTDLLSNYSTQNVAEGGIIDLVSPEKGKPRITLKNCTSNSSHNIQVDCKRDIDRLQSGNSDTYRESSKKVKFEPDEAPKARLTVKLKSLNQRPRNSVEEVEVDNSAVPSMTNTLRKCASELKQVFYGTKNFSHLIKAIKMFEETKNPSQLGKEMKLVFKCVPQPQRDLWIIKLTDMVDKKQRAAYLVAACVDFNLVPGDVCSLPDVPVYRRIKSEKK